MLRYTLCPGVAGPVMDSTHTVYCWVYILSIHSSHICCRHRYLHRKLINYAGVFEHGKGFWEKRDCDGLKTRLVTEPLMKPDERKHGCLFKSGTRFISHYSNVSLCCTTHPYFKPAALNYLHIQLYKYMMSNLQSLKIHR